MSRSTGIFWTFEYAPSPWPARFCWAASFAVALPIYRLKTMPRVLAFLLIGLLAVLLAMVLSPVFYRMGVAMRHRMACSRAKLARRLTKSEVLLVGYCKRPNGSVTFAGIMTFNRLQEISPEAAHLEIKKSLLGLFGEGPIPVKQSDEVFLDSVYAFADMGPSAQLSLGAPLTA